jgi:hypothetical protein
VLITGKNSTPFNTLTTCTFVTKETINSTLSDYMIYFSKIVVPAWIAGPVRARSDSAELEENPGLMDGFRSASIFRES